jgi:sec-independent protein translocase protein TatB
MNMAGKWAGKARAMATEFRRSFDEMARESELAELRKEIEELKKNNPVNDLANSMASVESEVNSSIQAVAPAADTAPVAAEAESIEPRSGEFAVTDSAPRPAPGA